MIFKNRQEIVDEIKYIMEDIKYKYNIDINYKFLIYRGSDEIYLILEDNAYEAKDVLIIKEEYNEYILYLLFNQLNCYNNNENKDYIIFSIGGEPIRNKIGINKYKFKHINYKYDILKFFIHHIREQYIFRYNLINRQYTKHVISNSDNYDLTIYINNKKLVYSIINYLNKDLDIDGIIKSFNDFKEVYYNDMNNNETIRRYKDIIRGCNKLLEELEELNINGGIKK